MTTFMRTDDDPMYDDNDPHVVKAGKYLNEQWRELRNDASFQEQKALTAAIMAFHAIGLLDDDRRDLWLLRIMSCPGHFDEGGRTWCAYCGDLTPEDGEEDTDEDGYKQG